MSMEGRIYIDLWALLLEIIVWMQRRRRSGIWNGDAMSPPE